MVVCLRRNRKTGFKCPRGCGKATKFDKPCPGKIDKSHPIHPRCEATKRRKKAPIVPPPPPPKPPPKPAKPPTTPPAKDGNAAGSRPATAAAASSAASLPAAKPPQAPAAAPPRRAAAPPQHTFFGSPRRISRLLIWFDCSTETQLHLLRMLPTLHPCIKRLFFQPRCCPKCRQPAPAKSAQNAMSREALAAAAANARRELGLGALRCLVSFALAAHSAHPSGCSKNHCCAHCNIGNSPFRVRPERRLSVVPNPRCSDFSPACTAALAACSPPIRLLLPKLVRTTRPYHSRQCTPLCEPC